jgi:hypothetical protein
VPAVGSGAVLPPARSHPFSDIGGHHRRRPNHTVQGPGKLTEGEARRLGWENYLAADPGIQRTDDKDVRSVVSAIFTHAKRLGWHTGENPASLVQSPISTVGYFRQNYLAQKSFQ